AVAIANVRKARRDMRNGCFPGRRDEMSIAADERFAQAALVVRKIEGVAALDAQEVAVDAALVTIIAAHDLHSGVGAAHADRSLATIGTVRTGGADMLHLPRPRLVAIRA